MTWFADALRKEAGQWQSEREEWLSAMRSLRQNLNDKLMELERTQAQAQVELHAAKSDMQVRPMLTSCCALHQSINTLG